MIGSLLSSLRTLSGIELQILSVSSAICEGPENIKTAPDPAPSKTCTCRDHDVHCMTLL